MPGSLYAVEFDHNIIKVGRTRYPERVLKRYQSDGRRYKRDVTSHWISQVHNKYCVNETALKRWCRAHGNAQAAQNSCILPVFCKAGTEVPALIAGNAAVNDVKT